MGGGTLDVVEKALKDLEEKILPWMAEHLETGVRMMIDEIPRIENLLIDAFETLFAPRQMIRQLLIVAMVQCAIMGGHALGNIMNSLVLFLSKAEREQREVVYEMGRAKSYKEWLFLAARLDFMRGYDKWRLQDHSSLYDYRVIRKRIDDTVEMIQQGDVFQLMFRLRGGLARDQYGVVHEGLFSRATAGTKKLIEEYYETIGYALDFVCDTEIQDEEIPTDAKLAFFNETRHAYGRSALLLSGGAYMGYYHIGVVKSLFLEGLLPRVISGASAGSLMAAFIGVRTDEELREGGFPRNINTETGEYDIGVQFRRDYFMLKKQIGSPLGRQIQAALPSWLRYFLDPLLGLICDGKVVNLDTEHFKRVVRENIGDYTFQEAFDRTGRIINITVAPMNDFDPPRLLNYLTAPHVCMWSATAASCAVPGLFDPITLMVKDVYGQFRPENEWTRQANFAGAGHTISGNVGEAYTDGSIENDLPMQQLSELFNVNHFIVSQVNAHSALLSSMALKASVWSSPLYGTLVGLQKFLKAQSRDWLKNIVKLLTFRSHQPSWSARRGLHQMLTQDYEGRETDVTITPWIGHVGLLTAFRRVIRNPDALEYVQVVCAGEAATWPYIARIRAHSHVEVTLDKCVQRLRRRIAIEETEAQKAALERMSKAPYGPDLGGETTHRSKIDRTPSFYTTRSIVNLGGLSVADPVLPAQAQHLHLQRQGHPRMHAHDSSGSLSSAGSGTGGHKKKRSGSRHRDRGHSIDDTHKSGSRSRIKDRDTSGSLPRFPSGTLSRSRGSYDYLSDGWGVGLDTEIGHSNVSTGRTGGNSNHGHGNSSHGQMVRRSSSGAVSLDGSQKSFETKSQKLIDALAEKALSKLHCDALEVSIHRPFSDDSASASTGESAGGAVGTKAVEVQADASKNASAGSADSSVRSEEGHKEGNGKAGETGDNVGDGDGNGDGENEGESGSGSGDEDDEEDEDYDDEEDDDEDSTPTDTQFKTTYMANFYYKKGRTDDSENSLADIS